MFQVRLLIYWNQLSYPLTQHDFWHGVGCFAYKTFHVLVSFWCIRGGLNKEHSISVHEGQTHHTLFVCLYVCSDTYLLHRVYGV